MLQNNYVVTFKDRCCFIYDPDKVLVAKLPMVDKSFPLQWNSVNDCLNYAKCDESRLWHKRYGHCNYVALQQLSKEGLVRDMPDIIQPNEVCGSCQMVNASILTEFIEFG